MAAWFNVVAPFLPDIIQMARPIFTRARNTDKAPDLVPQQIVELQDAAAQNADATHKLAEDMQQTIAALQQGATTLERRLERANRWSQAALVVALLGFALAAYALAG